jgi:hypothetical protein
MKTVQSLVGHAHGSTFMLYTRVVMTSGRGIARPLDVIKHFKDSITQRTLPYMWRLLHREIVFVATQHRPALP